MKTNLELLKEFVERLTEENVVDLYFHHNAGDGSPELNIALWNMDWSIISKSEIETSNNCAVWE